MLFSYKYTVCHYYLNAYVEKVVKWLPCPAGRQEKIWFSEESFEAPNPPTGGGKQNSQGSSLISVPCPQGVSSFLWEPGSRAVGWSWPWCPALHCLLCTAPCGGIHGGFSVRAALLTSTESTLQGRQSPLEKNHRFLPDHWRTQGNFV